MADLLPERLGTYVYDEEPKARTKKQSVTNILEWLQCFAVYVAVRGQKQPERIRDFMGYQALIIDAYLEYKSNCWMGYDRRFRQIAASDPGRKLTQHCGIWLLLDKQKPHDARIASACLTVRMIANFPQEVSHNLLTSPHQWGMEQGRS